AIARYFSTGQVPGPLGARHPSITPFEAFKAKDGHLIVAAGNDALFAKLCDAIGRADLASNPLFLTNATRTDHAAALRDELEQALAAKTVAEWLAILDLAGVPSGPINDVKQALEDPQIAARNMVVAIDDKDVGALKMAGNPIKLSAYADPATRGPVPDLDGDRAAILKGIR
ncbi:MAG: CoA transferase, partial [Tagaea sp.]|nr:CoA transferase [Tagaea sp.]